MPIEFVGRRRSRMRRRLGRRRSRDRLPDRRAAVLIDGSRRVLASRCAVRSTGWHRATWCASGRCTSTRADRAPTSADGAARTDVTARRTGAGVSARRARRCRPTPRRRRCSAGRCASDCELRAAVVQSVRDVLQARGVPRGRDAADRDVAGARPAPARVRGDARRPRASAAPTRAARFRSVPAAAARRHVAGLPDHVARVPHEARCWSAGCTAASSSRAASARTKWARGTSPSSRCSSGTAPGSIEDAMLARHRERRARRGERRARRRDGWCVEQARSRSRRGAVRATHGARGVRALRAGRGRPDDSGRARRRALLRGARREDRAATRARARPTFLIALPGRQASLSRLAPDDPTVCERVRAVRPTASSSRTASSS